jgi:uncharacterized protein YjbJ (UPF0337 family)
MNNEYTKNEHESSMPKSAAEELVDRIQHEIKRIRQIQPTCNNQSQKKSTIMNELKIKGNWNEKKGNLKQKYAELTDDDLRYAEGKEEELVGRVQQRLGVSKDEARNVINKA